MKEKLIPTSNNGIKVPESKKINDQINLAHKFIVIVNYFVCLSKYIAKYWIVLVERMIDGEGVNVGTQIE